jgi:SAM-dependent methyltransferase
VNHPAPCIAGTGIFETLSAVSFFFDQRKVGDSGFLGFRRSTDLAKLCSCLQRMIEQGFLIPGNSTFLDLGCGDGRVSILLSYLVRLSAGVELNEWILEEYGPLKSELERTLVQKQLPPPPGNLFLFHGDSMDEALHQSIKTKTGIGFEEFDLFYTYLIMQEEFADLIAKKAKPGSLFMVYGLDAILPRFKGLSLLTTERAMEGVLALYRKEC